MVLSASRHWKLQQIPWQENADLENQQYSKKNLRRTLVWATEDVQTCLEQVLSLFNNLQKPLKTYQS